MLYIQYYLIVSIDTYTKETKLSRIKPEFLKRGFMITETESESPAKKHRKYTGIVSAEKLYDIYTDLYYSTCKTMGSLTELGWLPAVSWETNENERSDYYNGQYSINIYVSPIISNTDESQEYLETLPELQREIKLFKINHAFDAIMETLENAENVDSFPDCIDISLEQVEIEFPEFITNKEKVS